MMNSAMMMFIRYPDGSMERAVLLAASGNALRGAIPGREDTMEFRLHSGVWVSEANEPVEIEFGPCSAEETWGILCDEIASEEPGAWDMEAPLSGWLNALAPATRWVS